MNAHTVEVDIYVREMKQGRVGEQCDAALGMPASLIPSIDEGVSGGLWTENVPGRHISIGILCGAGSVGMFVNDVKKP